MTLYLIKVTIMLIMINGDLSKNISIMKLLAIYEINSFGVRWVIFLRKVGSSHGF